MQPALNLIMHMVLVGWGGVGWGGGGLPLSQYEFEFLEGIQSVHFCREINTLEKGMSCQNYAPYSSQYNIVIFFKTKQGKYHLPYKVIHVFFVFEG
jgi:hypothetical protein